MGWGGAAWDGLRFQPHLGVGTTRWCLHAPRTHRSGAVPAKDVLRTRLLCRAPPLFAPISNVAPMADPGSVLCLLPIAAQTTLQRLQTVSVQQSPVLSPGLSTEAQAFSTQPPCTPWMHVLGWGVQGGGQDPLCWSLCSACWSPIAAFSSETLKLPICPS